MNDDLVLAFRIARTPEPQRRNAGTIRRGPPPPPQRELLGDPVLCRDGVVAGRDGELVAQVVHDLDRALAVAGALDAVELDLHAGEGQADGLVGGGVGGRRPLSDSSFLLLQPQREICECQWRRWRLAFP